MLSDPSVGQDPPVPTGSILLRPYQVAAVEAIRAGYRRGVRRPLLVLATGLGKTVTFGYLAVQAVNRGRRVLIVAHREELLGQAREKIRLIDPSADVGIVQAERDQSHAQIVVASIQTIARPDRLARLGHFALIVIDEAHHAAAPSYRSTLEALRAFEGEGPVVLGVTATPGRGDGVGLDSVFQEVVYEMGILDGIQGGYLVDLRAIRVGLNIDFSDLSTRGGDLDDGELGDALIAADAPEHVTRAYLEHASDRLAIVFTPTVAVARSMADALNEAGVPSAWVSGETPREARAKILADLEAGRLRVVANCGVLTEGFDCPPVSCVITARPTKSVGLYQQMVGRATRLYPGKQDALILDVVGQAGRHDLVSAASLFGVSPDTLDGRTVTEALEERQREEAAEAAIVTGKLVSAPVDLFRSRPLHWVSRDDGSFVLAIADGNIRLRQTTRGWIVRVWRQGERPATIGRGLPLEYAQGVAEDHARKLGGSYLADPNATWRQKPASLKQLAVLRRRGLTMGMHSLTAGQASDLIATGRRSA